VFRRFCSAVLVVGLVAATALLTPGAASAGSGCRPLDAATRAAIDTIAEAALTGGDKLPGLSLVVDSPKGCYHRSYGVRDVRTKAPMQAADHVRIASITKTYTATLILQMVDKGLCASTTRSAATSAACPTATGSRCARCSA